MKSSFSKIVTPYSVLVLEGDSWLRHNTPMLRFYRSASLSELPPLMAPIVDTFAARLDAAPGPVRILPLMMDLTLDLIAAVAFSVQLGAMGCAVWRVPVFTGRTRRFAA